MQFETELFDWDEELAEETAATLTEEAYNYASDCISGRHPNSDDTSLPIARPIGLSAPEPVSELVKTWSEPGYDEPRWDRQLTLEEIQQLAQRTVASILQGRELGSEAFNELKKENQVLLDRINAELARQGSSLRVEKYSELSGDRRDRDWIVLRDSDSSERSGSRSPSAPHPGPAGMLRSWRLHEYSHSQTAFQRQDGSAAGAFQIRSTQFDYQGRRREVTTTSFWGEPERGQSNSGRPPQSQRRSMSVPDNP